MIENKAEWVTIKSKPRKQARKTGVGKAAEPQRALSISYLITQLKDMKWEKGQNEQKFPFLILISPEGKLEIRLDPDKHGFKQLSLVPETEEFIREEESAWKSSSKNEEWQQQTRWLSDKGLTPSKENREAERTFRKLKPWNEWMTDAVIDDTILQRSPGNRLLVRCLIIMDNVFAKMFNIKRIYEEVPLFDLADFSEVKKVLPTWLMKKFRTTQPVLEGDSEEWLFYPNEARTESSFFSLTAEEIRSVDTLNLLGEFGQAFNYLRILKNAELTCVVPYLGPTNRKITFSRRFSHKWNEMVIRTLTNRERRGCPFSKMLTRIREAGSLTTFLNSGERNASSWLEGENSPFRLSSEPLYRFDQRFTRGGINPIDMIPQSLKNLAFAKIPHINPKPREVKFSVSPKIASKVKMIFPKTCFIAMSMLMAHHPLYQEVLINDWSITSQVERKAAVSSFEGDWLRRQSNYFDDGSQCYWRVLDVLDGRINISSANGT